MKRFIAIAATAICCMGNEMPAKADYYSHSFPGVGPHGTTCSTFINGNYGSTSCSRNLSPAELAADKAQHNAKIASGLRAAGLPSNYCSESFIRNEAKSRGLDRYHGSKLSTDLFYSSEVNSCTGWFAGTFKGIYSSYHRLSELVQRQQTGCDMSSGFCRVNGRMAMVFANTKSLR